MSDDVRLLDQEALVEPFLGRIIERTEVLVGIDSGSHDAEGVDAVSSTIEGYLAELGFVASRQSIGADRGACFRAVLELGSGPRLLILGHADTVWPQGTAADWRFAQADGLLSGPGVGDMKCALVMAVQAVEAALCAGVGELGAITYALVPDEELGSVGSRAWIEELGRGHDMCLTLEAGLSDGGLITSRGAVGAMIVTATGRTAHSTETGGASALRALAPAVDVLESLSDRVARRLCSVGILRSGTARQVVPDHAEMHIDLRAFDTCAGLELQRDVTEVVRERAVDGVTIDITGGVTRPAMPQSLSDPIFAAADRLARAAGRLVRRHPEMGGSDGSFVADQGVLTLDGLGPVAHAQCSRRETVEVDSIVPRTALLSALIRCAADVVASAPSVGSAAR